MKRKSLLFALLLAFIAPWAASAQSVTIGEGTSTNQNLPSNSYYNYAISQQIYTADEINASGNITSIAFYNAGTGTAANNARKFDIYMAHTTKTDFNSSNDWIALTDSDIVYHGTADVTLTPNTWTTFTLNTQFAYNGTDNLVVCVIDRSGDYTSSNHNMYRVFSTGSEYQAIYKSGDGLSSLNPDGTNGTSAQTYSRLASKNQIILGGIQQSCAKPTNLAAALTQGNGTIATLSWTENGQATSWLLQVATNDAFTANLQSYTVNNTPSQNLTSLTAERTYYARVQPACDNNNKYWSATCEFTPTNAYIVTLSEGTTSNSMAPLVTNYRCSYDQMIYTASQIEAAGITGPCTITKIGFNAVGANTINRLPVIYICQTDKSSFSSSTDFISINEFTKVYDYNNHSEWTITAGWNEFELDTPFDYDGTSNLVVAVHCGQASTYSSSSFYTSSTTNNQVIYAYNDNTDPIPATYEGNWGNYSGSKGNSTNLPSLKLYYEPIAVTCAKPTGLAVVANSLTAHSVAMQWDSEANAVYDYAIVKGTGIDPETVTYAGSETASGTTCSHTWSSGLDGDSDYTVFIRKNCGNGDYSAPATKVIHTEIACPAPTTLACTAVTANTATLSWTENGSATAWEICLNGDETNPNGINTSTQGVTVSGTTVTYVMPNLTAETVYTAKVRSVCGGIDGESAYSNTVSFEPTNKITIGSGTSTNSYLPAQCNYDYSYTQQIYTVAELGTAGLIESIDFYMTGTSNYTYYVDVYMVSTDKSSFTGNTDWIAVTNADLVFGGNVEFNGNAWTTITLADGFIYDGTQNVAIIVDGQKATSWSSKSFLSFTAEAYQSHYGYQDTNDINPSNPGTPSSNSTTTAKNQIRILKSALSGCLKPGGLTATVVDGHNVTLSWKENGSATAWEINKGDGSQNVNITSQDAGVTFDGTNVTYTLGGLTPETPYSVTVRGNCGGTDGNSDWSNPVSFTTGVACPAPTLQPVSGITNNSATISWTGSEAGSFDVRYRAIDTVFFESFESGIPSGWSTIDNDGDGFNWSSHINTGTGNFSTHTGDGVAISASYDSDSQTALTPDNWLITPQLNLQGTMKVWLRGQDESTYEANKEHFAIYLSQTGTDVADFDIVLISEKITNAEYKEYTADLSGYTGKGYIAIRHFNCTDQFYLNVDDFGIYGGTWQTPVNSPVSTNSITLTGLDAETLYEVEVQANCGNGDGESAWVSTTFTTLDDCAVPYELEVANPIAPTSTLTWTGAQDNYNVRYRTETFGEPQEYVFEEGFEGGSMPTGWTTTGSDWIITSGTGNSSYTGSANGNYNAGCYISSYSGSDILITPAIDLSQATSATLTFNFWNTSWDGDINTLNVYYRVDGGNWSNALYTNNSQVTPWTSISVTLPSSGFAANYQIGFECVSNYSYGMGIDDVKITYTAPSIIYGEWVNKPNVTSPLEITNLTPSTTYEWQVQGVNCDGNNTATDWSAPATFTTLEGYTKTIEAYEGDGGYYLIASPLADAVDPTTVGMITDDFGANVPNPEDCTYDFFAFDQDQELEWVNYRGNAFNMVNGKGYLYASKEGTTITFIGMPYSGDGTVTLDRTDDDEADFQGWNLVGNPFAEEAYVDRPFYVMDANGAEIIAETNVTRAIQPMEGIFVTAEQDGEEMTFYTEDPNTSKANLVLNITQGRSNTIDRAIISVGQGRTLPKFMLNPGNTKLYIPQNGEDYAVVCSRISDEIPVSFEPAENGLYTISVDVRNMNLRSLLLKDKVRNVTIDLLRTPSYQFKARTEDRADRFMLSFRTSNSIYKEKVVKGANSEDFGFFSYGNWVIDNEGEATLQVIDLNGRVLSTENIYGSTSIQVDAVPGVYMLRLINGDNVKVQKIVVE